MIGRLDIGAMRRAGGELTLFALAGLFLAILGPYRTYELPLPYRLGYWITCLVGGGLIGAALDRLMAPVIAEAVRRVPVTAIVMTLPVTVFVYAVGLPLAMQPPEFAAFVMLLWQVLVVSFVIMAVRALAWRSPRTVVETRITVEPPLPEAEAAFRRRLSAKRRTARLVAVEAHDHYLRVHTDAGEELLTMRFADALAELARAHGYQVHRSWWVSAGAIEGVSWRRGGGEVRLVGGRGAPVSRNHAGALRSAGWT